MVSMRKFSNKTEGCIVTYSTHLEEQSARMHLEELRKQEISQNAWLKPWKVIR